MKLWVFLAWFGLYGCVDNKDYMKATGSSNSIPPRPQSEDHHSSIPQFPDEEKNNALVKYLTSPTIDPVVKQVADLGVARYNDPATKLRKKRNAARFNLRAGRVGDWILTTFNESENAVLEKFKKLDGPQTFTIEQIDSVYDELVKKYPRDPVLTKADFVLAKSVGINYLNESPLGKDAFVQLASQFNFLESPGVNVVPVSAYISDSTQGPQGSIEAAAAAMHRTAAVEVKKLPHALTNVLPKDHAHYYENGYLQLFKVKEPTKLAAIRESIKSNLKKIAILPQWVINEASGVMEYQVFASAAAFQNAQAAVPGSVALEICTLLLTAQYEALAKLAVIRSLLIKKPVPVHFTLVGGGAFNNPKEARAEAIRSVANIVRGYKNVRVFMHGYTPEGQDEIRKAIDRSTTNLTEMDNATFMKTPL